MHVNRVFADYAFEDSHILRIADLLDKFTAAPLHTPG